MSNKPISEQYREAGDEWVAADAAASLLEECKTATRSQMMLAYPLYAVNKAEMTVLGSQQWRDYIKNMVAAREKANYLKVKMEHLKMKAYEQQSDEATKRLEMKLT